MNHSYTNKNKGAALVIALLVISVVSGIVFFLGRLSIKEITMMNGLEDSMTAYYAAEAGIEHGLLVWRNNHGVELPAGATLNSVGTVQLPVSNKGYYQLKIWHTNDVGVAEQGILTKDQSVEYSTDEVGLSGDGIRIEADFSLATGSPIDQKFLEITPINNDNQVTDEKSLLSPSAPSSSFSLTNTNKIRLRAWLGNNSSKISYKISPLNSADRIDGRYTYIDSTGYFGDTKRKLEIKIDRANGTILDVYDFVLFGSKGISTPTP